MVLFQRETWERLITTFLSIIVFVGITKIEAIIALITKYPYLVVIGGIIGIANRGKIASKLS